MRALTRWTIPILVALVPTAGTPTAAADLRDSLLPQEIDAVRINLNPWGAGLGFETVLAGDDPRVEALAAVIREAEPGGGHKCSNSGAIRFFTKDGAMVGVGLLPSHTTGLYELRLYAGDEYLAAYRIDRAVLLAALADVGVPIDDPAFRE